MAKNKITNSKATYLFHEQGQLAGKQEEIQVAS